MKKTIKSEYPPYLYCNRDRRLKPLNSLSMPCRHCVKVELSDLQYVRDCLRREDIENFEYRKPLKKDIFIGLNGELKTGCYFVEPWPFRFTYISGSRLA